MNTRFNKGSEEKIFENKGGEKKKPTLKKTEEVKKSCMRGWNRSRPMSKTTQAEGYGCMGCIQNHSVQWCTKKDHMYNRESTLTSCYISNCLHLSFDILFLFYFMFSFWILQPRELNSITFQFQFQTALLCNLCNDGKGSLNANPSSSAHGLAHSWWAKGYPPSPQCSG